MGVSTMGCGDGTSMITFTTHVEKGRLRLDAAVIRRVAGVAVRQATEPPGLRSTGPGWSAGSTGAGEDEAQYHGQRRVLRAAGREFTVPPDQALVLLVTDEGTSCAVTAVHLQAPEFRSAEPDLTLPHAERAAAMTAWIRERNAAWLRAIRQDATARAFLEQVGWLEAT